MCTVPPIYAAQLDGILRLSEYMLVPSRIHTPPTPQPRYIVWIFHFATHEIGLNHEYIEAHSHWGIDSSLQYPLQYIIELLYFYFKTPTSEVNQCNEGTVLTWN